MARRIKAMLPALAVAGSLLATAAGIPAQAAGCGNGSGGYEAWKDDFIREAAARGVDPAALRALAHTRYNSSTIAADRGQKSFKLSLDAFMRKRGGDVIIARGRKVKERYGRLFAAIERGYGVPPGPLLAIWGMETGFGRFMGDQHILSAVATLAYDCRRTEFFTGHLYAALALVERGMLDPAARGAAHGEIGQTQFLPGNALSYGVDGDGDGHVNMIGSAADALASTANYLHAHGWQPEAGYQPGEPNFAVLEAWNAASVYQRAIAIIAGEIDGY